MSVNISALLGITVPCRTAAPMVAGRSGAQADGVQTWRRTLHALGESVLMASVGFLTTILALRFANYVHQFVFAWPVTGVLMALVLPRWKGPLVLRVLRLAAAATGVFLGSTAGGMPAWVGLEMMALTVVELCLMVALLLPAVPAFTALKHRRGVMRFALTAILVPLCSAMIMAPSLAGFLHQPVARVGIQAFFANSLGIALTYPLGLFLFTTKRGSLRLLLGGMPLTAIGFFILVSSVAFWQNTGPFLFVVFPPMIVVLMLLGLEGAILVSLLLSAIGWFATAHGHGPIWLIHNATPEYRLLILQIFIWTCLATAMPVGALLDERREAEQKAEEAHGISQIMLGNAEEMILLSSLDGSHRYVSPAVERLTGWTPEEYLARERMDAFHPDDRDLATTTLNSLSGGKWEHTMRYRAAQKQGGYRWVEATMRAYGNKAEGVVKGYVAAVRDISVQRQNEHRWEEERAALAREQSRLSNLASTDMLTGVPNRRSFEDLLSHHEFDMRRQAEHVLATGGSYNVGMRKLRRACHGRNRGRGGDCGVGTERWAARNHLAQALLRSIRRDRPGGATERAGRGRGRHDGPAHPLLRATFIVRRVYSRLPRDRGNGRDVRLQRGGPGRRAGVSAADVRRNNDEN